MNLRCLFGHKYKIIRKGRDWFWPLIVVCKCTRCKKLRGLAIESDWASNLNIIYAIEHTETVGESEEKS